jgi:hypothetical protein
MLNYVVSILIHSYDNENSIMTLTIGVEISCDGASLADSSGEYCDFVDWTSARIYASQNFSYYSPGTYLSRDEQHQYAKYLFEKFSGESFGDFN